MPEAPLVDDAARATITTDLGRSLFVEAGAGSGKTSSLVDRIVNLVVDRTPVDSIAAITFTEAAATELRHRVREALGNEAIRSGDRELEIARAGVETAAFTTLHGFALRLLTDHPIEAGLPPGFGVLDEISSLLAFEEAWRVYTGRIGDDLELLDLQARAAALGLEFRRLRPIARQFDDQWDLLGGIELEIDPLPPIDPTVPLSAIADLAAMAQDCLDPDDKLAAALAAAGAECAAIAELEPLDQLQRLAHFPLPGKNVGKTANWPDPDVEAVRARIDAARSTIGDFVAAAQQEVLARFRSLVAKFVLQRVRERQRDGELTFHDILVLARRLLRSDEEVRHRLHQRYQRILLDEFQDTDPIQIELAVLISSARPVERRPWPELAAELPPGRLVVVGDPKQSIYRFRGADIGVYDEANRTLHGGATKLTSNFRSVPGIVDWVNHVFAAQIGSGDVDGQPPYTPLDPVRPPHPDATPPVRVIGQRHERAVAVGKIRELEAADVAAVACRAISDQWMVDADGTWRQARLGDIAVLIPSRLSLPALESAFAAVNVPFRPETSSLVYATQEVRDVLSAVRSVAAPAGEIDVVAALRSALFAVGDDDLLSWKLAGGSWDYRHAPPAEVVDHPVAAAFDVLRSWHEERYWAPPAQLLERIVRERRLREQALAWPRPRDRWRRYRFLVEQARQFAEKEGGDLLDFVRWVEIQSSDLARVTEPFPTETDDDAVRVLTIHGSKGLEFPIVILAGAPTQERGRASGPGVLWPADRSPNRPPEIALARGRATVDYEQQASVEEVLDLQERVRLHYVAATRARDILVVSAHHKENASSMGRRTWDGLQDSEKLWVRFEATGRERYEASAPTQLRMAAGTFTHERASWSADQRSITADSAVKASRSATSLAAAGLHDGAEPDPERTPWRRGRAGTNIGSAVHAVLQHVDLRTGDGLGSLARLHAEQEGIPELAEQVEELARSALSSTTVQEAVAGRYWRELYVAAPAAPSAGPGGVPVVLEGYVDLLYETAAGLVVVDFKTDAATGEAAADQLVGKYGRQGAAYAVALAHVTGHPVIDCRFLFLSAAGAIERSVPDLAALMGEVRSQLRDHA